jgi:hypothetical protein
MTRSINTPTMPRTKKINYVYCTDSNINIKIKYSHSFFNLMVLCGSFKYLIKIFFSRHHFYFIVCNINTHPLEFSTDEESSAAIANLKI